MFPLILTVMRGTYERFEKLVEEIYRLVNSEFMIDGLATIFSGARNSAMLYPVHRVLVLDQTQNLHQKMDLVNSYLKKYGLISYVYKFLNNVPVLVLSTEDSDTFPKRIERLTISGYKVHYMEVDDHASIGKFLGYPDCCVLKSSVELSLRATELVSCLEVVDDFRNFWYEYLTRFVDGAVKEGDIVEWFHRQKEPSDSLYSFWTRGFYPHSCHCQESKRIGRRVDSWLQEPYKSVFRSFLYLNASNAYLEGLGRLGKISPERHFEIVGKIVELKDLVFDSLVQFDLNSLEYLNTKYEETKA